MYSSDTTKASSRKTIHLGVNKNVWPPPTFDLYGNGAVEIFQNVDTSLRKPHADRSSLGVIKNAHHPSETRQIGGVKRTQPRVDAIKIKYPYTHYQ